MKTYGKAKITRHKAGSLNKSLNNDTTFVKKKPKSPKGSKSIDEAVAKFVKSKGGMEGSSTKIIIKTTSAKVVKKKMKAKSPPKSVDVIYEEPSGGGGEGHEVD
jgi:hypothetical protein